MCQTISRCMREKEKRSGEWTKQCYFYFFEHNYKRNKGVANCHKFLLLLQIKIKLSTKVSLRNKIQSITIIDKSAFTPLYLKKENITKRFQFRFAEMTENKFNKCHTCEKCSHLRRRSFMSLSRVRDFHLNIGWISCIILSNLNIQNIPRMASPIRRTRSSNQ